MLVKDLKVEHPLIYERILEIQRNQGNRNNDNIDIVKSADEGNFDWIRTIENVNIWLEVASYNYNNFYKIITNEKIKRLKKVFVANQKGNWFERYLIKDLGSKFKFRYLCMNEPLEFIETSGRLFNIHSYPYKKKN